MANTQNISAKIECPSYDDYFMAIAVLVRMRSKDPVTKVGACIVGSESRLLGYGYNGFPRNCSNEACSWEKSKSDPMKNKKMYVVHAEANAILHSNGTRLTGTCLYTTLFPCNECTKLIIQSGISKVLYLSDKYYKKDKVKASKKMLQLAGVEVIRHVPQQAQININFAEILNEDPSYLGSN